MKDKSEIQKLEDQIDVLDGLIGDYEGRRNLLKSKLVTLKAIEESRDSTKILLTE